MCDEKIIYDVLPKLVMRAMENYCIAESDSFYTSGRPIELYPSDLSWLVQKEKKLKGEIEKAEREIRFLRDLLDENEIEYRESDDDR
jgi:hypothetical protein